MGSLPADRGGDPLVAVAEAGDGGTAGAVDDLRAVGGVQVDALATDSGGRNGAGTMQDAAGMVNTLANRIPMDSHQWLALSGAEG